MPVLRVDGQDLYYKWSPAADAGTGLTLLFIHGLGSSHSFYASITPKFVQNGYSCLTLDTPGSGLSTYASRDRSPSEIAQVVAVLVSSLDIDSSGIVAVGHSMGAMVVSELALQVGLRGVVLLGPVHPTPTLGPIFAERIKTIQAKGLEVLADTIPEGATGSKSTALHHAFIRSLILSQSPEGYISLCRTIANAQAPRYGQVQCPLLIVAGSEDKTSSLAGCNTILDSWGSRKEHKQLEVLDGVGHWHCVEAYEEVCQLVEVFANGLRL